MNAKFREHPDFFFPIAMITAGTVWLLINNGMIDPQNLLRLLPLWPVLLILGGLSLLLRQLWWPLPSLLWLAAGGFVLWLLLAPQNMLPALPTPEVQHETFREALGGARSAAVTLDLSINASTIHALEGGEDLLVADIYHMGNRQLEVTGSDVKTVRLVERGGLQFDNLNWLTTIETQPWDIGLTTEIPLDLEVDMSTGKTEMDLSALQLSALALDASTGSATVQLPRDAKHYNIKLDQSTGNIRLVAPKTASFDLTVDGSTGNLTIDVDDAAGVRVEVRDDGTGRLILPEGFSKVQQSGDDDGEGVWQNAAFETSKSPISIIVDLSTGNLTIE